VAYIFVDQHQWEGSARFARTPIYNRLLQAHRSLCNSWWPIPFFKVYANLRDSDKKEINLGSLRQILRFNLRLSQSFLSKRTYQENAYHRMLNIWFSRSFIHDGHLSNVFRLKLLGYQNLSNFCACCNQNSLMSMRPNRFPQTSLPFYQPCKMILQIIWSFFLHKAVLFTGMVSCAIT
jgi:hypothetical protein